jgi:hypothetical protein
MFEKTVGSRAEVAHGTAKHTSGGLTRKDLFFDKNDGRWKSVKASDAANDRLKREGDAHLTSIWKPKKSGFKLQAKEGTKEYEKKMKKFEKKQKDVTKK